MVGVEKRLRPTPCHPLHTPGVTQRYLDCGLHEVATGDKDSVVDQKARVFIAELLVQCGADPDNRQHGCGGTPLHHTQAGMSDRAVFGRPRPPWRGALGLWAILHTWKELPGL